MNEEKTELPASTTTPVSMWRMDVVRRSRLPAARLC
jgi:hypothetical protein